MSATPPAPLAGAATAMTGAHPSQPAPSSTSTTSQSHPPDPQAQQVSPAQRTAEARTAFTAALHSAASNLDSDLQSRAKNIHTNAKALQKQEADVEREVKELRRANADMERELRGWKGEWAKGAKGLGLGGEEGDMDGIGEFDLEGIERDLGMLNEWVSIVEEEGAEREGVGERGAEGEDQQDQQDQLQLQGQGQGKGKGKEKQGSEG